MTAITFVDVIVSHQEFTDALLFHELVHVAQYAQMDMKEFAARFVNGFIQGGSFEEIPWRRWRMSWKAASARAAAIHSRSTMKCGSGERKRFKHFVFQIAVASNGKSRRRDSCHSPQF